MEETGGLIPLGKPGEVKPASDAELQGEEAAEEVGETEGEAAAPALQGEEVEKFYPVAVHLLCGEVKATLELSPADTVADVRQLLADTPESCYYTCYGLNLVKHARSADEGDGGEATEEETFELSNDFIELGELIDFEVDSVELRMHERVYNVRAVHEHMQRFRELTSLDQCHTSPSSSMVDDVNAEDGIGEAPSDAPKEENSVQLQSDSAAEKKKKKRSGKKHVKKKGGGQEPKPSEPEEAHPHSSTEKEEVDIDESLLFAGLGPDYPPMEILAPLLPPATPRTLKELHLSPWNTPPGQRSLVGDLLYLELTTLEGRTLCVTAHCRGFFINRSSANTFDPRPFSPKNAPYLTLVALMQNISPLFNEGFAKLQSVLLAIHPLEAQPPPPPLGMNPFLLAPEPAVVPSQGRTEIALHNWTGGYDAPLEGRDWNEEFQSCRELPSATLQERLLRDRTLYRITADFLASAMQGAKLVIEGNLTALNPADNFQYQMFVHNGIFYSFAHDLDADEEKAAAEAARAKAEEKKKSSEQDKEAGDSKEGEAESKGETEKDSSQAEDLLDGEQATFISANNDMRGTRAFADADTEGLHTLAMVIIDFCGNRVVAQSIIPGILHGDRTESLKYGSVDNGKTIAWDEKFHSKVVEASAASFLKEHTLCDGEGKEFKFAGPSECKGIEGCDGRLYLLDLIRATPRDTLWDGRSACCSLLRPELVSSLCRQEGPAEKTKPSSEQKEATEGDAKASLSEEEVKAGTEASEGQGEEKSIVADGKDGAGAGEVPRFFTSVNPNACTDAKLGGDQDEMAEDIANVQAASKKLQDQVIPKFISDCKSLDIMPVDGLQLTEMMHKSGINMRYLGKIVQLAKDLPHIELMGIHEIISRCAKHEMRSLLRGTLPHGRADSISKFFNCLLGTPPTKEVKSGGAQPGAKAQPMTASNKRKSRLKRKVAKQAMEMSSTPEDELPVELSHSGVFEAIRADAWSRYRYDLSPVDYKKIDKVIVLRSVCLKTGISLAAKTYNFDREFPIAIDDVQNLSPVVKYVMPKCRDGKEFLDTGNAAMNVGNLTEAMELLNEAAAILQHVYGPLHKDVAAACKSLAMCHYHAGEINLALQQQRRELLINERLFGSDHPDTIHSYASLALFYHNAGHPLIALKHMQHALQLLDLVAGRNHPDCTTIFINVAMLYQDAKKIDVGLRYLTEAMKRTEKLLGPMHTQTAVCFHALAIIFNTMGNYKLAIQHEKSAYNIFKTTLGDRDKRTIHSANWVRQFAVKDLQDKEKKRQAVINGGTANGVDAKNRKTEAPGVGVAGSKRVGVGIRGRKGHSAAALAAVKNYSTAKPNSLNTLSVDDMLKFIEGEA